jgi:LmbE family N-acetylglucosaminyl deacetylase
MKWLSKEMDLGRYGKIKFRRLVKERMRKVRFFEENQELNILCLGAHPDDIEIGCGGTILRLIEEVPRAQFYWTVFSGDERRGKEACESAEVFLKKVKAKKIDIQDFRESYFPFVGAKIKDYFEKLGKRFSPDIVFTHCRNDAHQDHRVISDLTWNTFRDNIILEYEVPKYDGDLRIPNLYIYLNESQVERKINHLCEIFQSQKKKQWFDEETFRSISRIRGIESNSPSKYAEAFYCRKIVF